MLRRFRFFAGIALLYFASMVLEQILISQNVKKYVALLIVGVLTTYLDAFAIRSLIKKKLSALNLEGPWSTQGAYKYYLLALFVAGFLAILAMLPAVLIVLLTGVGIDSNTLQTVSTVIAAVYFAVVFVFVFARVQFSACMVLAGDRNVLDTVGKSWKLTRGNTINLAAVLLLNIALFLGPSLLAAVLFKLGSGWALIKALEFLVMSFARSFQVLMTSLVFLTLTKKTTRWL